MLSAQVNVQDGYIQPKRAAVRLAIELLFSLQIRVDTFPPLSIRDTEIHKTWCLATKTAQITEHLKSTDRLTLLIQQR